MIERTRTNEMGFSFPSQAGTNSSCIMYVYSTPCWSLKDLVSNGISVIRQVKVSVPALLVPPNCMSISMSMNLAVFTDMVCYSLEFFLYKICQIFSKFWVVALLECLSIHHLNFGLQS